MATARPGVTGGIALLVTALIAGCSQAPVSGKYEARAALQAARDAGAGDLAPALMSAAEEAFKAGTREMDRQSRRLPWRRSFGRSRALFETALRRSRAASDRSERQLRLDESRAHHLLLQASGGFSQMEWLFTYLPPRSSLRSAVQKAKVSYTEARTYLAGGDYRLAVESARRANEELARARASFSNLVQPADDPGRRARYRKWVDETVAWSRSRAKPAIIVDKMRRTLTLISKGRRVKTYRAELGVNGTLVKMVAGDRATPEGRYRITEKRGPKQTKWYKALMLDYPNKEDLKRFERARRQGEISSRARPGSLIEIHGEGGRGGDWTDGCVALTNSDMDDLFARVSVNTPVTIVGFEVDTDG